MTLYSVDTYTAVQMSATAVIIINFLSVRQLLRGAHDCSLLGKGLMSQSSYDTWKFASPGLRSGKGFLRLSSFGVPKPLHGAPFLLFHTKRYRIKIMQFTCLKC